MQHPKRYIGGSSTCSEAGTSHGSHGIRHERLVESMNSSVRFHHARFGADAHERAHRIKHIDEEEGEDDDHHIDGEDVGEIKLAEDRRNRRWHIYQSVYFREYEESVQTHTRSQSERFLGIDRHHECTHNGSQYGGSEYSVCIHALSGEMTEDVRVTARI